MIGGDVMDVEQVRARIASELGIPESLVRRIQGDDEDAMRADAEELAEAIGGATPLPRGGKRRTTEPETKGDYQYRRSIGGRRMVTIEFPED